MKNRQVALQRAIERGKVRLPVVSSSIMQRALIWRIGIFVLCATLLGACAHTPDEQRIRNGITAMQQAAEAHQPRDFMAYISPDFTGEDGTVDRTGLANILRVEVLRDDKVGVTLGPIDLDMQGDRATAHVMATLTGGSGGLLPEHGAIYSITSGWKRDGRDWRCYNASWEQKL